MESQLAKSAERLTEEQEDKELTRNNTELQERITELESQLSIMTGKLEAAEELMQNEPVDKVNHGYMFVL